MGNKNGSQVPNFAKCQNYQYYLISWSNKSIYFDLKSCAAAALQAIKPM